MDSFVALVGGALVNIVLGFRIPDHYGYALCSAVAFGLVAIQLANAKFKNRIPSVLDVVLFQATCALFLHFCYSYYLASFFPFIDHYILYFTDIPASYFWLHITTIYSYASSTTKINFIHICSKIIVLNFIIKYVVSSNNLGVFGLLVKCGELYIFTYFTVRYSS